MKRLTAILLVITIVHSCEAPYKNPLDPKNPVYNYARISGIVQTISLPVEAIPQTTVNWQGESEVSFTDQQGKFELLLPDPQNGWLYFRHPDFHPDSVYVNWPVKNELTMDAYLNTLPSLDSLSVYSVVLNRFPSLQKEQLIIESYIHDRDNDMDSVFAILKDGTQNYHLPYNTTEKNFRQEFTILDLGVLSIEEIVGQTIQIGVSDLFSNFLFVGQGQLTRVIHNKVTVISPTDNMITGPSPTLEWHSLETAYNFHYNLEIYTNEVAPVMVWQHKEISREQTTHTVDTVLPEGSYFWVIWAIDDFGNRTRSIPAAFNVQVEE